MVPNYNKTSLGRIAECAHAWGLAHARTGTHSGTQEGSSVGTPEHNHLLVSARVHDHARTPARTFLHQCESVTSKRSSAHASACDHALTTDTCARIFTHTHIHTTRVQAHTFQHACGVFFLNIFFSGMHVPGIPFTNSCNQLQVTKGYRELSLFLY